MINRARYFALVVAAALVAGFPSASSRAARPNDFGEYYYNAGQRVAVSRSATRVALRVGEAAAKASLEARLAAVASVGAVRDVEAGGLLEITLDGAAAESAPAELEEAARAAGGELLPVFYESAEERGEATLFVTDELLVQFRADAGAAEIEALAARHGVGTVAPLSYAENGFRLRVVAGGLERNALTVANAYFESGLCRFAHPNFLASRSVRFTPNDPQFASQWHLKNTGQGGGAVGADVEAEAAWDISQGSASVTVAVADTGIDWHHEDLAVTVDGLPKVHSQRDVVHGDDDPFPQPGDADRAHGTAASGVAVAAFDNATGVAGIAPKCRLMPIQLYAESTFTPNSTEADAFAWAADHGADVMTNSWGPDVADTPLPDATRAAIDYATSTGRGGRGMVILFAAGNSNFSTNRNNYCNYSGVIAVAASTNFDTKAGYSNFGPAISVAAPSSGGTRSIATTDATGSIGYSSGNYTTTFGGTSSASPLAAGVAALVLSVNPNLTWRQVKRVLEQSADKIDPANGAYDALGRSDRYGYGRVNARRAVELAVAGGPDTPGIYSSGTYFLRDSNSNGAANAAFFFGSGAPGLAPLAGDWDGNGTETAGLHDPAAGAFFLRNSNDAGVASLVFNYGSAGAVAVAGDWDGDGVDTVGIYVPATGVFFLKNANAAGAADLAFSFGAGGAGLVPVTGDWDGDGVDTVGLYNPADGAFFLRNSNSPGAADAVFFYGPGGAGVEPVAGDWDNDGSDSVGVYDASTGAFFLRNAAAGGPADWVFSFGVGGATPLAGDWDGQ